MKKVFLSLVVFFLALVLFACGGKNVTMTFETNGGNEIAPIVAKAGNKLEKPSDPTKEDFTFGGWFSDVDLLEPYTFPEVMPAEDTTIYAKWVVTITFDSQGGPEVAPIVGEPGRTYTMPENPTRDGYVFIGWYTDQAYTNKLSYVMPKKNTTAYARWQVYETGSKVSVPVSSFSDNDKVFALTPEGNGTKITATSAKGEWSYVATILPFAVKHNTTIAVEIKGTAGTKVTLKLEGGDASPTETTVEMTGNDQTVIWTCEESNLSTVIGQKFLVFLNGGTTGCGETPEYVIIKSLTLYRTVEASDTQKAALYFATNGGDEYDELYAVPGTAITMPADPTRPGYSFQGWFKDAELTQPFDLTTLPASGAVAYAKWEKDKEILPDINLLGHEFGEVGGYDVITNDQGYEFTKLSNGEEWSAIIVPFPQDVNVSGYNHLRITFVGPEGQKLLVKINDKVEKWITCTGKVQEFDYEIDFDLDTTKGAVVLFANAGVAGESGTFKVTRLALGNHEDHVNLIVEEGWTVTEGVTNFEVKDGKITISKNPVDGAEWDAAILRMDNPLIGFNRIHIEIQGTAGEKLLVKAYDVNAGERWIECDGTVQVFDFEYELELEKGKPVMVIFANAGEKGTGHEFVITNFAFYLDVAEAEPTPTLDDLDLLGQPMNLANGITHKVVATVKKVNGNGWENFGVSVAEPDYTGINKLVVEVKGPSGEQILFKPWDAKDCWVNTDGTVQTLEFDLSDLTPNTDKFAVVVFANAGAAATSHDFVITKLQLTDGADKVIDLLVDGKWPQSGDQEISLVHTFSKQDGEEWGFISMKVEGDLNGYDTLQYTVKAPSGKEIILKVNDQVETKPAMTGDAVTGEFNFDITFDANKLTFLFFIEPGATGTGAEYEITELKLVQKNKPEEKSEEPEAPVGDINLLNNITSVGDGTTHKVEATVKKVSGEGWEWFGVSLTNPDYDGINTLIVEVKGENGEQILFKLWDSKECWFTADGTSKTQEFDLTGSTPNPEKLAAVIFANAGVAPSGHAFVITKMVLTDGADKVIDLLANGTWTASDSHEVSLVHKFSKSAGSEWSFVGMKVPGDLSSYNTLVYTIKAPEGKKIVLKVNDQVEQWKDMTGSALSGEFEYSITYDQNKLTFLFFIEPGEAGSGAEYEITELKLIKK